MRFCVTAQQNSKELRIKNAWKGVQTAKKPRRVCAAHGANKVKLIFSGGKWVRLQEHKRSAARLAKSNPCSAYVGENTSRPASWVRLQLCKLCAAQLVKSNPCSAVEFLRQRRRKYARSRVQLPMRTSPHRERGRKPPFQTRAQRSVSRLKRACQNDMRANAAIAQGIRPAQRINCASG